MGVRTKIIPLLQAHNGLPPEFEATDDYLRLRMLRAKPQPSLKTGTEPA
jgi:hypothetical protein